MRIWLIIYKENDEIKSRIIYSNNFDDAVYEAWDLEANKKIQVKGIFEVRK